MRILWPEKLTALRIANLLYRLLFTELHMFDGAMHSHRIYGMHK